jgi:predicted esterase
MRVHIGHLGHLDGLNDSHDSLDKASALSALSALSVLSAPRLPHDVTLICCHNMYCHTPWGDAEQHFAIPGAIVRVLLVLAPNGSWHDYPDWASLAGGVAWCDLLDMASLDRADDLLERLVSHETKLLGGRSERLVLFGLSQGGCQALLRFLRSPTPLGAFVGAVCHVPTAPHTPLSQDPLRAPLGCNARRPIRLLAGRSDSTLAPGLVRRDVERLRAAGFSDVDACFVDGLGHDTSARRGDLPVELEYLRSQLPQLLDLR